MSILIVLVFPGDEWDDALVAEGVHFPVRDVHGESMDGSADDLY